MSRSAVVPRVVGPTEQPAKFWFLPKHEFQSITISATSFIAAICIYVFVLEHLIPVGRHLNALFIAGLTNCSTLHN